jgi:hypothetical protein
MNAVKDRLRHSERPVSALVQLFFSAPVNHAWFPFKYFANGLLAERPELGDLDDRVVLLAGEFNRRPSRRAGNRVEGVGGLGWFSSEFRHGMTPTIAALFTNLIPAALIVQ